MDLLRARSPERVTPRAARVATSTRATPRTTTGPPSSAGGSSTPDVARVCVDVSGGRGGLVIRIDERHHYEVVADGHEVRVRARVGPLRQVVATHAMAGSTVVLWIETHPSEGQTDLAGAPDVIRLGYEDPDGTHCVAELDGRYLSSEVAGGFTGRVLGMFAIEGVVAFDWFDYAGSQG